MPLPRSGPYGGAAVYQCDGYGCRSSCSVETVVNEPAALRPELVGGWMLKKMAGGRWDLFCPDCAPTRNEPSRE